MADPQHEISAFDFLDTLRSGVGKRVIAQVAALPAQRSQMAEMEGILRPIQTGVIVETHDVHRFTIEDHQMGLTLLRAFYAEPGSPGPIAIVAIHT